MELTHKDRRDEVEGGEEDVSEVVTTSRCIVVKARLVTGAAQHHVWPIFTSRDPDIRKQIVQRSLAVYTSSGCHGTGIFGHYRQVAALTFTDHRKQLKEAEKPVQSINA